MQVWLPYGRTGALQFNSTGQRVNYKLHLYNHGGADMYKKVTDWRQRLCLNDVDKAAYYNDERHHTLCLVAQQSDT